MFKTVPTESGLASEAALQMSLKGQKWGFGTKRRRCGWPMGTYGTNETDGTDAHECHRACRRRLGGGGSRLSILPACATVESGT